MKRFLQYFPTRRGGLQKKIGADQADKVIAKLLSEGLIKVDGGLFVLSSDSTSGVEKMLYDHQFSGEGTSSRD